MQWQGIRRRLYFRIRLTRGDDKAGQQHTTENKLTDHRPPPAPAPRRHPSLRRGHAMLPPHSIMLGWVDELLLLLRMMLGRLDGVRVVHSAVSLLLWLAEALPY